jgi:hypothetical protein
MSGHGAPVSSSSATGRLAAEALTKEQVEFFRREAAREAKDAAADVASGLRARDAATAQQSTQRSRNIKLGFVGSATGGSKGFVKAARFLEARWAGLVLFGAAFSGAALWYCVTEAGGNRADGVCVNCNRQKEIAEEIYFGKKPQKPQNTARFLS